MSALEGFDLMVRQARDAVERGNLRAGATLLENEATALRALEWVQAEGALSGDD